MKKGIILAIFAVFMLCLVAPAQDNYDRYYKMYNDAMAKKSQGNLDEAKTILLNIKKHLKQGGIPKDNDLNHQIALCTTIAFSESQLLFEARGKQNQAVTIRTNSETFSAKSELKWCIVNKKGNTVLVYCLDNTGPNPRSSKVIVTSDYKTSTFSVLQQGAKLELYLHPNEVNFTHLSEKVEVSVVTNAPSWRVDSIPLWMEYKAVDSTLILQCAQNNATRPREATVYVVVADESFPVYVHQAEADTIISVDKKELTFPDSASEANMTLTSNVDNLQVKTSDKWIAATINSDQVIVSVQQNDSVFGRHGWVRIGCGSRQCEVKVSQKATLLPPTDVDTLIDGKKVGETPVIQEFITVNSWPSHLKVSVRDDYGKVRKEYTPFDLPVDNSYYYLALGFEQKNLPSNKKQEVLFKPGLRFAAFTWAPKAAIGMMSGVVGSESWGVYGHIQATTPIVTSFDDEAQPTTPFVTNHDEEARGIAGYNMTFGPIFCYRGFPYLGVYAGIGAGAYAGNRHIGLDYEAGIMGFYKNMTLTMGFHTSRVSSSLKHTAFTIGFGGYLKRYYEEGLGYCSSDSRRWLSLNYVFRPAENGRGLMVGDIGRGLVRPYVKFLFISNKDESGNAESESKNKLDLEGGGGVIFTPMSGIIDLCAGVSLNLNVDSGPSYQGFGAELGAIVNVWRFPITIMVHESDLFGEPHLYVDFGIGFHLGRFSKAECTYQ